MLDEAAYESCRARLEPGDLLVFYSDGVTETMDAAEELYGDDRFRELLVRERARSLGEIVSEVRADLDAFRGRSPVGDDVSMLLLRRRG